VTEINIYVVGGTGVWLKRPLVAPFLVLLVSTKFLFLGYNIISRSQSLWTGSTILPLYLLLL